MLLVHNRDQMLVSNLGSAKKHKTVVSHSSCEFPLNTCEMPADRLLGLSFFTLCLVVCFGINSKLSSSSILILNVPPTKMFPLSRPPEKPADKNSSGWPLGGCCLCYTTIFISSRDVTLLLRELEVSGQNNFCLSRLTPHLTFRIDQISIWHDLRCNTLSKWN